MFVDRPGSDSTTLTYDADGNTTCLVGGRDSSVGCNATSLRMTDGWALAVVNGKGDGANEG